MEGPHLPDGRLMRLGLSSAAAPDASLEELLDACARRGLPALELEEGHGHGLDPGVASHAAAEEAAARARDAGVELAGFRLETPLPSAADGAALVGFTRALGAPLLVPEGGAPLARTLREAGAPVRLVLAAPSVAQVGATPPSVDHELPLAWDADPARGHLSTPAAILLREAGRRLAHIRLLGGGPEATEQEGRGVGALMARLALHGYAGTVVLAPSSPRYRVIWDAWLGRRGGWGCGSRHEDRTLVTLGREA